MLTMLNATIKTAVLCGLVGDGAVPLLGETDLGLDALGSMAQVEGHIAHRFRLLLGLIDQLVKGIGQPLEVLGAILELFAAHFDLVVDGVVARSDQEQELMQLGVGER